MYDPDSEDELNGDLRISEYDNNRDNDNKDHILRAKVKPVKTTNNKNYPA